MSWYVLISWPANHEICRLSFRIGVQDRYLETTIPQRFPLDVVGLNGFCHCVGCGLGKRRGRPEHCGKHQRTKQTAFHNCLPRWQLTVPEIVIESPAAKTPSHGSRVAKPAPDALAFTSPTGSGHARPSPVGGLESELRLGQDPADAQSAEACFRRALEIARGQRAKSWELRAASRLARLRRDQGKRFEAHVFLAPVYDWFTEGFDTADLKEAKGLLNELR
jgi:hypothetical protein